ncbi:glucose-6-phosphate exchanger SLC37A1 isoform X7 [Mirounga angustirostris]|uniref:glucose-6-phosphate exchanger SLC37A1 isoform X7 n=1 Tax=Mirounga angustirostris TaxID=9716 RepID=UPI00313CBB55
MAPLPPGIRFIISFSRDQWYRAFIFILTFLLYASFHLSRKPISIVKIINGLVQTTGWPSVVTCLGNWFGKGRRGLIMGVWNSHTSVGNILGSLIAGYWVSSCWGLSFIVPGVIVAAMGIVCFLFLIEHPKDIACSSSLAAPKGCENGTHRFRLQKQVFTDNKNKPLDPEMQCLLLSGGKHPVHQNHVLVLPADGRGSTAPISFTGALRIPGVIEFSLCLLFAKLVSYTFLFWLPLYITNVDHLDARQAGELSTLFDVGGIFGGILAGVISDRLEKRASTCGLMLLLAAPTLYIFSTISKMGLEATIAMLLLSGALVSGPYALITTAVSADLGTHKSLKGNSHALATVTAIIDGTGSVGAALGPLLAGLLSPSGWNNVFYMLMFADACALLVQGTLTPRVPWREAGPVPHKLSRQRSNKGSCVGKNDVPLPFAHTPGKDTKATLRSPGPTLGEP